MQITITHGVLTPKKLAEREGFEPSIRCRIHTFQACAFNHSAISPKILPHGHFANGEFRAAKSKPEPLNMQILRVLPSELPTHASSLLPHEPLPKQPSSKIVRTHA